MASLVLKVQRFINKERGNIDVLARKLGYRSTMTLRTWIKKNRIPEFRRADINQVLNSLKEKNAPLSSN